MYYLVDPFTEEAELDKNECKKIEEFINAGKIANGSQIQLYFLNIIY
jgi:hypothetical protein